MIKMIKPIVVILILALLPVLTPAYGDVYESDLAYLDNGQLVYGFYANQNETNQVNQLPDFSFAGYKGGGVPIPHVPTVLTLSPSGGDDTAAIQNAINTVGAMTPDANGFRGAILLEAGRYEVSSTVVINASGVVLRGEGQDVLGTVIEAVTPSNYVVIELGAGSGIHTPQSGTERTITTSYVPSGATTFAVSSTSGYAVGDEIIVQPTRNQFWIDQFNYPAMDMPWSTSYYNIYGYERIITAISGNTITVNIPLVDVIQDIYGGGRIYKPVHISRINQSGIENLRIESTYANESDENHPWIAMVVRYAEDSWIRGVTAQYFVDAAVRVREFARRITIEDSACIDPKGLITGARRNSFHIDGTATNILVQRCYSSEGRHDFTLGSKTPGPNAYVDCYAALSNSDSGPHHRWATGNLFDNVYTSNVLAVENRENLGSGHGWSGAQTVFWNCQGAAQRCDAPNGAMNFAIGSNATKQSGWWSNEPFGWWEHQWRTVTPRSLYYQQLADRLGMAAVDNVTLDLQQAGRIWEDLAAWRGRYRFQASPIDSATPADQPFEVSQNAVFEVEPLIGATIVSYEWYELGDPNLVPIGTDSPVLTLSNVQEADFGRKFFCRVITDKGPYWSRTASLGLPEPSARVLVDDFESYQESTTPLVLNDVANPPWVGIRHPTGSRVFHRNAGYGKGVAIRDQYHQQAGAYINLTRVDSLDNLYRPEALDRVQGDRFLLFFDFLRRSGSTGQKNYGMWRQSYTPAANSFNQMNIRVVTEPDGANFKVGFVNSDGTRTWLNQTLAPEWYHRMVFDIDRVERVVDVYVAVSASNPASPDQIIDPVDMLKNPIEYLLVSGVGYTIDTEELLTSIGFVGNSKSGYCYVDEIYVSSPPEISEAHIPSPFNGATSVELNPVLSWNTGLDAFGDPNPAIGRYYLYLSEDDPDFTGVTPFDIDAFVPPLARVDYMLPYELDYDGLYYWRVDQGVYINGGISGPGASETIVGTVWQFETQVSVPVITQQPIDTYAALGATAEFTVEVDSISDAYYTWYKVVDGGNDVVVAGPTLDGNTLVISPVLAQSAGFYYCRIVNDSDETFTNVVALGIKELVAHWKLDDNYQDASGNGYTLTAGGWPEFVEGIDGQAVGFDDNAYLDAGIGSSGHFDFALQGSVSAWVKTSQLNQAWASVVTKGFDSWRLVRRGDGDKLAFHVNADGHDLQANGEIGVVDGQWHHVVGTWDGTHARLYIDGQLDATSSGTTNPINQTNDPVWIGSRSDSMFERTWAGAIDDVRLYNHALSPLEVEVLYHQIVGQICLEYPVMDIAGPTGVGLEHRDCVVDIYDLAALASDWLTTGE